MDKINFQNGVTKVNAETFNTFQNNINETSHFLQLASNVAKGGTITIPVYYKVRSWHIRCLLYGRKVTIKLR